MYPWYCPSELFWYFINTRASLTETSHHLLLLKSSMAKQVFFFKKNGPIPASFCPFSLFSQYNFNNTNRKKLRWCAWDSNPGPQDGRRRQNHGVMAATQSLISFLTPLPLTYYLLTIRKVHWKVIKQVRKDLANTFYPLNCRLPLYVPRYKLGRIFLFSGLMLFQYFMQWMNGFR